VAATVDNVNSANTTVSHTTIAVTLTIAGAATDLIVAVGIDNLNGVPAAGDVTCVAGVTSMTQLTSSPVNNNGAGGIWVFGLASPPTGSVTVTATCGANASLSNCLIIGAISFLGSSGRGTPVVVTGTNTGTSMTLTVGSVASTSIVAGFISAGDDIPAPSSGTQQFLQNVEHSGGNTDGNLAGATNTGSGSVSLTWSGFASSDTHGGWAAEIKASGTAAGMVSPPSRRLPYRTAPPPPARRRGRITAVVPAQLNPPYPFAEIAQKRQTWPRGIPRRGRQVSPVPPQLNPPYPWAEIVQRRQAHPRSLLRRGRQVTAVPPQLNPPYPFTEVRQWRQLRGMLPRRGRQVTPVPAQQAATPNPAITFQQARHQRVLYGRRSRVTAVVPAQDSPVTQAAQRRETWPRAWPRRGRTVASVHTQGEAPPRQRTPQRRRAVPPRRHRPAEVIPAQVTFVNPAWVQGHRAPARAIALIRRRFRQLLPWPQAAAPAGPQQGTVTVANTYAATVTVSDTLTGAAVVAGTLTGTVTVANTTTGTVNISNQLAGTVTIVNDL
jgi:hypothetical protein